MARTIRDTRLDTRSAREKLRPSPKPYWRLLDEGVHFGYRKGLSAGKWCVRLYRGERRYVVLPIGTADDGALDADGVEILTFSQGQAKARDLATQRQIEPTDREGPKPAKAYTLRDCLGEYLVWMTEKRKSAVDAKARSEALIIPTLGDVLCDKLTKQAIDEWLARVAKSPARIRSKKTKGGTVAKQRFKPKPSDDEGRRKRRASANRTLTILKAALNRAWRDVKIASDDAWRRVEPFEEADAARIRYLTIVEAQRLINSSRDDFRLLVRAALATGARYGELAALKVGDFNPDSGTLHVRTSKSGKGRHVVLADEGIALFAAQAAGRPAGALLLPKADGQAWRAAHQARPMREACQRAAIVPEANFHCLRHTFASHAIMNGAPLLVVAKNLGHSGTRMVERHYGHLADSYVADAIRAAAPKFGVEQSNIVPLTSKQTY